MTSLSRELSSTTKALDSKWFAHPKMRFSHPGGTIGTTFFDINQVTTCHGPEKAWLLVYIRGGRTGQNIRLDRAYLIGLEQVFERGHAKLLASAAQHDGFELKMVCGSGVAQVRNSGA